MKHTHLVCCSAPPAHSTAPSTQGFHEAVLRHTEKAAGRQQLLEAVWKGFVLLWTEALNVRPQLPFVV